MLEISADATAYRSVKLELIENPSSPSHPLPQVPAKHFKLIFLHEPPAQLLWIDILAKKTGGRGGLLNQNFNFS
jgi:hypothetical protein